MNATTFYHNWRKNRIENMINKFDIFIFFMVSFLIIFHFVAFHVSLITLPDIISYFHTDSNYSYFFLFDIANIALTISLLIFRKKIVHSIYYKYGAKNIPRKIIPDLKANFDPALVDNIFKNNKVNIQNIKDIE